MSIAEARRLALAAQGFAQPRPTGKVDRRHLRRVLDQIGLIQIDSVNVLVRSQELPLFARLGPHPRDLIHRATDDGELFEYWVHEASHVPTAQYHLHRWRMDKTHQWKSVAAVNQRRPGFVDAVYARVRDEGGVVAGDLSVREGPKGSWWDWDDAKMVLEYLFWSGQLAARRRRSDFARVYDLPERYIPAEALARRAPPEVEARKELLLLAAKYLGVGTLGDLTDYHRQGNTTCRPLLKELVEEGSLVPVKVDGWKDVAYRLPNAKAPRRVTARALLSPFDPIVWNRDRAQRLFDFHYRIEIYTPAPKRQYGYYVLPFLLGDELVGRVDLKADRQNRALLVQGAYTESGVDRAAAANALAEETRLMAQWLELDRVEVAGRGDLAKPLVASLRTRRPGSGSEPK